MSGGDSLDASEGAGAVGWAGVGARQASVRLDLVGESQEPQLTRGAPLAHKGIGPVTGSIQPWRK